jgi:hypothetical protein
MVNLLAADGLGMRFWRSPWDLLLRFSLSIGKYIVTPRRQLEVREFHNQVSGALVPLPGLKLPAFRRSVS